MTAATRYNSGAIAFHWIIAALIVLNFIAVWVAEDMPKEDASQLMGIHKAVGISILVLTVLRILWRLTHRPPPFPESMKAWEVALARVVHSLFYFLMVAIPFTGWSMVSAYSGKPVSFFGLFDVPALPYRVNEASGEILHEVHETFGAIMLVLLALHVAGALKHHFVDRHGGLARMIPALRRD